MQPTKEVTLWHCLEGEENWVGFWYDDICWCVLISWISCTNHCLTYFIASSGPLLVLVKITPLRFILFSSPELYDLYYYELYPNWIRIGINYTNTNFNSIFWVVWIGEVLIRLKQIILYDKRRHWSHYPDTPFNLVSGGFFFILITDINILPCICSSSFIVSSAKISLASFCLVSR